jgi:pyridoxal 5'-phosphate synthase pdxT subunit
VAGKVKVGILALQGATQPHARHLERVGAEVVWVRKPDHLVGLAGIILPGGESSAMIHLLKLNRVWEPLKAFAQEKPVFGVCAGAILLASRVTHPEQDSLHAIELEVARNAFGRQVDSFIAPLVPTPDSPLTSFDGVFIRAPRFTKVGASAKVLLQYQGEPVMVEQGKCLAASFHPELTENIAIHHYFVTQCESEAASWTTASPKPFASPSIN